MTKQEYEYVVGEVVSLKEYFETRLMAMVEYYNARLDAQEKANRVLADAQTEANRVLADALTNRFNAVNELRGVVTDQQASFVTKEAIDAKLAAIDAKFDKFDTALVLKFDGLRSDIDALELSAAELRGKASQQSVNQATTISYIGLVLAILGIAMAVVERFVR